MWNFKTLSTLCVVLLLVMAFPLYANSDEYKEGYALLEKCGVHFEGKLVKYEIYWMHQGENVAPMIYLPEFSDLFFDCAQEVVLRAEQYSYEKEDGTCMVGFENREAIEGSRVSFSDYRTKWNFKANWEHHELLISIPKQDVPVVQIPVNDETAEEAIGQQTSFKKLNKSVIHFNKILENYPAYGLITGGELLMVHVPELGGLFFDVESGMVLSSGQYEVTEEGEACLVTHSDMVPITGSEVSVNKMPVKWKFKATWQGQELLIDILFE